MRYEEERSIILLYEFLDYVPLNIYLKSMPAKEWTIELYKPIAMQILNAVCYCHTKNVIHGDLNMHNVLISPDNKNIKIIDFGCAKNVNPKGDLYSPAGHPKYRPPKEEFFSVSPFEAECWSVGLILLGLLLQAKINTRKAMNLIKHQWKNIEENELNLYFLQVIQRLLVIGNGKEKISLQKALTIIEKIN